MNNRELLDIIEEIKKKQKCFFNDIADEADIDRSYLSKFVNAKSEKTVTPQMLRKFKKAFPVYFENIKTTETTKKKLRNDTLLAIKIESKEELLAEKEKRIQQIEARRQEAEATAQYLKEQLAKAQTDKDRLFDALAKAQDVLIKNTEKIETNLTQTRDQILQLKDQTFVVSDQLARQEQALGIVTKKIPAPTSKKDKQSSVHQQDGGKKGIGD
jgi:chromosome segregation ATPase